MAPAVNRRRRTGDTEFPPTRPMQREGIKAPVPPVRRQMTSASMSLQARRAAAPRPPRDVRI